jgi:hypothetical protein
MAHSVEIVQSHHRGWRFRLPDCTADNGLHGRLAVGEQLPTKQVADLLERLVDVEIVLRQGDALIDRGHRRERARQSAASPWPTSSKCWPANQRLLRSWLVKS